MKNIIILLCFLLPVSVSAQVAYGGLAAASQATLHRGGNPASLTVQINNPVFFNYTTVDELLQPKVIGNAFLLKLKSSSLTNTRVFAQIEFGSKRRTVPEHWVSLKLLNKSSATAIADNNDISLSGYPILLFTQPPDQGENEYNFNYNIVLSPLTKHVRPDNYNFTITFTMTQP